MSADRGRAAGSEWPDFIKRPRWAVQVLCDKLVNRRDVEPGTRMKCKIEMRAPLNIRLREAVSWAEETANKHMASWPGHQARPVLEWHTTCRVDKMHLQSDSSDGLWLELAEHCETSLHQRSLADWQLLKQVERLLGTD